MLLVQEEAARFSEIVSELVCDAAGLPELQELLKTCLDEQTLIDVRDVLGWPQITAEPADAEESAPDTADAEGT